MKGKNIVAVMAIAFFVIFALIGTASATGTNRTVSPSAHLFAENITVTLNATSIPVNGSFWINGTTNRWASNGTQMFCTISTGADRTGEIINGTLMDVIADFNETSGLATYSILWNSRDNIAEIEASSTIPWNAFNETYYITVNDSAAKNTTQTFRITDSISVNPATGVPGYNFTARGTSSRENGTKINVSLQTLTGIPIRYVDTTAHNGVWNVSINASSGTGTSEIPLTCIEPYYIVANDSIVKAQSTLTLGGPWIDLEVIPAETTMDGIVWFNGTTDLPSGWVLWFNITTSTGKSINVTDAPSGMSMLNATVNADHTFNASWRVNTSTKAIIAGNFTAPSTTYSVVASNGTGHSAAKTLTVTEYLTITTPDVTIAPGGEFTLEGTLNRVDGYPVKIRTADAAGTMINTSTALVYNGTFNATLTATYSIGNLPVGNYTITAMDATAFTGGIVNASAAINMTVAIIDWNPWDDDGVITTEELQEAVYCWVTDTPMNGHTITTPEIQELVYLWLTSSGDGIIDLEVIPAVTTMDGIVWFNGTTDLATGTIIDFNITTSTGKSINKSRGDWCVKSPVNATVNADTTFNTSWQVNASWLAGNVTPPLTTLTVNASNGTVFLTKTLTVNETLTITTPDVEICSGGEFTVEGTLNRVNGHPVRIVTATPTGTTTNETMATVYNGEWNTTLTATYSGGNLPMGTYTITAMDATAFSGGQVNASTSINMTVAPCCCLTLVEPVDGTTYYVNDTVPISGTSNLDNGTIITVWVIKSGGGFTNSSITTRTDATGAWSAAWNMTADAAFHALTTKTGDYQIIAANGSGVSAAHTITIAETVPVLTVTATPTTLVMNTSTDVTFTVTSDGTAVEGATVTLSGVATGSGTTDANGQVTLSVTATRWGTITATASKTGYADGTTTVTAACGDGECIGSSDN